MICAGLSLIFFSIMMKSSLFLKTTHIKARAQNPHPIYDHNGQNRLQSAVQDFKWEGANEAKVGQTTEMYSLSDPVNFAFTTQPNTLKG